MEQEKISHMVKQIRIDDNLSQQKFAEKYGVTPQAVSKWENGKSIPDITILQLICKDHDLDLNDFFATNKKKQKSKKIIFLSSIFVFILILVLCLGYFLKKEENFQFKRISASCDNFNLYGSIAYNDSKSSIYISNITYCGGDDENTYDKINCSLYEMNNNVKTEISKCSEEENITLEKFLQNVSFSIDHYESNCKIYKENSLKLEIIATNKMGEETTYDIPLTLESNCS